MGILSPDSKLMRILSRLGDLILLNLLFLLTSLPIFTVGASATALFTVCFRFDTDQEAGILRPYFQAFRENFRQATVIWLILLALIAVLCFNIRISYLQQSWDHYLFILFSVVLAVVLFVQCYAFPLLSQFENRTRYVLQSALLMSIAYFPKTLLMAVLLIIPFFLIRFCAPLFLQLGLAWAFLYFAAVAYLDSRILRKVFKPYIEKALAADAQSAESSEDA